MLTTNQQITLNGHSKINDVAVENYTASFNTDNPTAISINSNIINAELRKENKEQCRADRNEFEDMAYALQDEYTANEGETSEDA